MIDVEGLRGAIAAAIDALCVRERRALTEGRPPIGDPPPNNGACAAQSFVMR